MTRSPAFNGKPLAKLENLCVSHKEESDPNVYIIGDNDFSFKMWCKDGKIYSKQRKCTVEILPGMFYKPPFVEPLVLGFSYFYTALLLGFWLLLILNAFCGVAEPRNLDLPLRSNHGALF